MRYTLNNVELRYSSDMELLETAEEDYDVELDECLADVDEMVSYDQSMTNLSSVEIKTEELVTNASYYMILPIRIWSMRFKY